MKNYLAGLSTINKANAYFMRHKRYFENAWSKIVQVVQNVIDGSIRYSKSYQNNQIIMYKEWFPFLTVFIVFFWQ